VCLDDIGDEANSRLLLHGRVRNRLPADIYGIVHDRIFSSAHVCESLKAHLSALAVRRGADLFRRQSRGFTDLSSKPPIWPIRVICEDICLVAGPRHNDIPET
jgi:hypothetical protein